MVANMGQLGAPVLTDLPKPFHHTPL